MGENRGLSKKDTTCSLSKSEYGLVAKQRQLRIKWQLPARVASFPARMIETHISFQSQCITSFQQLMVLPNHCYYLYVYPKREWVLAT